MKDTLKELRHRLQQSVERNPGEAILFSGGLDTSILALLSPTPIGLNMRLNGYGEDLKYAQMLAAKLGLRLYTERISVEEAIESIPDVIGIMESFDPALPNDLAIYLGLRSARENGFRSVITGDGADELFAGYSYMFDLNLKEYLPRLSEKMRFSSNRLGKYMGIEIKQPFVDKDFIEFALSIRPELKVRKHKGKITGKWVLREAFSTLLPSEIAWQTKRPIEMGSGFSRLHDIIGAMIPDSEMAEAKQNIPVKFLSKDHLFYYKTYRRKVGEIPPPRTGEAACPGCGTGIAPNGNHCRVCGWSRRL
jgi:asparagine synthase (glutamine-hydrolysing)